MGEAGVGDALEDDLEDFVGQLAGLSAIGMGRDDEDALKGLVAFLETSLDVLEVGQGLDGFSRWLRSLTALPGGEVEVAAFDLQEVDLVKESIVRRSLHSCRRPLFGSLTFGCRLRRHLAALLLDR